MSSRPGSSRRPRSPRQERSQPGRDANFVIFDTEAEFTVTPDILHYRHPISPYMGERLRGVVKPPTSAEQPFIVKASLRSEPQAARSRYR